MWGFRPHRRPALGVWFGVFVRDTRTRARHSPVDWASHGRRIPRRSAASPQSRHPPSSELCSARLWEMIRWFKRSHTTRSSI
uniref:Uncharacterized protein n=1 Tax=Zea mays TaxID=4577 RepID=B6U8L2_MAIZE|nr:hypothetical protein [Zea mays]